MKDSFSSFSDVLQAGLLYNSDVQFLDRAMPGMDAGDAFTRAASAVAEEVLAGIRTVVAFGGQEKEIER